jgi:hypothetical protein
LNKPKTDDQQEDEALNNIIMELSVEMEESETSKNKEPSDNVKNNLEQTVIIGEMEEGNIFDDFKNLRESDLT